MNYLLDTCVISELVRPQPSPLVTKWISQQSEESLFLSVLTIGEIQRGIEKLEDSKRKGHLLNWLNNDMIKRFEGRLLMINMEIAIQWGKLLAKAQKAGKVLPNIDGLLLASAQCHNMTVVTRNIGDFMILDAAILNPWESGLQD